jgi:dienelactone hydrolase
MDFLKPFVLPVEARESERTGAVDIYPPDDTSAPRPAVLVVHGGPLPSEVRPAPQEWPVYRGYASLLAGRGVVGATVGHRLHSPAEYPAAAEDVGAGIEVLRADPRVDPERIALWFFSGGGLLAAGYLREAPAWLRVVAFNYPLLAPLPGWPVDPVTEVGDVPVVLVRAGQEHPVVAEGVAAFVTAAAGTRLEIIDVPGQHGFDYLDDDDESRAGIERAAGRVLALVQSPT